MSSFVGIGLAAVVLLSLLGSVGVVRRFQQPAVGWYERASSRLVLGVPWGTLVVATFVAAFFLVAQDGITDPADPVSVPFRAWSYFSPLGMVTSSFAHASANHLIGNLAGTLVVAPIAEYVWGHYPDREGGRGTGWLDALRTTPWIRAVVVFPLAVVGVGLLTSLFALGPVIGFSGIVYAFVGFAIVRYPIATLLATTLLQSAVLTIYRALRSPVLVRVAEPSPPTPPSWANVAIQGHALGFFVGLVIAIVLLERRGTRPDPLRLWAAVVLFAISKGLWRVYWFGEGNSFLLYQGPGVAVVSVLGVVITLAVVAPSESVVPPILGRRDRSRDVEDRRLRRTLELARGAVEAGAGPRFDRIRAVATGARSRARPPLSPGTPRGAAFTAVLLVLAVVAGMAVPTNLFVLQDSTAGDAAIEVDGYTVEYAEGADNPMVSGFGFDDLIGTEGLRANGVIVSSERYNIWLEAISDDHLAFTGEETVTVGGPGWRETVHVERTGWDVVGNETVYQVWLWQDGDEPQLAFESNGAYADVRIDHATVVFGPVDGEFVVGLESDGGVATSTIPGGNESVDVGGVTFEREEDTIYAVSNGTAVAVASEETYN